VTETAIRLIGICGSPRKGGTEYAVRAGLERAAMEYGAETDFFSVRRKDIKFCIHCDYCIRKQQGCVHKDDLQELYPRLEAADAWLLGSPVYQGGVSAQLKAVLDRCRAVVARNPKVFRNKVGSALAVGGDRAGGQEPTIQALHDFYLINEFIPVAGGSFGANLGASVWSRDQGAAGVEGDSEGLAALQRTVDALMRVAVLVRAGVGSEVTD